MNKNKYGEFVFSDHDLHDLLMSEPGNFKYKLIFEKSVSWPVDLDVDPPSYIVNAEDLSLAEFDQHLQDKWLIPDEYKNLDIAKLILDRCSSDAELQRAGQELLLYSERNLLPLLNYMHYLVEVMHKEKIVWGVGRGSSVASFVLYLLGVHHINSLYYDLDPREFLK